MNYLLLLHYNSGYGNALQRCVYAYIAYFVSIILKYTSGELIDCSYKRLGL